MYQSPSTSGFMMMDRNTVEWKQHIICLGTFAALMRRRSSIWWA
jgi:hypothetical protein